MAINRGAEFPTSASRQSGPFAAAPAGAGPTGVEHVIYEDEDHGSVVLAAMTRGLRFAVPERA